MWSQRELRLEGRKLEGLWVLFSKEHRQHAQTLLGHLIANAARGKASTQATQTQEEHDEPGVE